MYLREICKNHQPGAEVLGGSSHQHSPVLVRPQLWLCFPRWTVVPSPSAALRSTWWSEVDEESRLGVGVGKDSLTGLCS